MERPNGQATDQPIDVTTVRWGPDGLLPAVVRDAADGAVLMLAYMDAEALSATLETGLLHFHSRRRGRLWRKGETSGNVLRLRGLALDCDADALLVTAEATGPACHTGARSCFEAGPAGAGRAGAPTAAPPQGFAWLETLWATIVRRAADRPLGSYTARLLADGVDGVARKVTEEATEVLLAARDDAEAERGSRPADRVQTREALAAETADLLYHTLVLCAERGLDPREVIGVLQARHRP
jgi:phosphoribosyl-ATP pyrophosphohydrolase/phosphoribosyl-AMP cyclohydrolase